jgi:glycosyltransferase involved in cell wall biosynthesis
VAAVDERDASVGSWFVTSSPLRVGLDLDGSLESLGNSMTDLADAIDATGECELVRFRTQSSPEGPRETPIALRGVWAPLWRRGYGRSLDRLVPTLDVIHVAGLSTPPMNETPLIISVDDLRPLREETRTHLRVHQLRRAVAHGALIVASSASASHEVQEVLAIKRSQVVVVPPAVPKVDLTRAGDDLVVNVTGRTDLFLRIAPELVRFGTQHGARVVALVSSEAGGRIRAAGINVDVRHRRDARGELARACVVFHISDGARFPSFAIAALAAGVPTIARATTINRELLDGAAALIGSDDEALAALDEVWSNQSRRAIMIAAGRARAIDFAPATAARAYVSLYRDVVRGLAS